MFTNIKTKTSKIMALILAVSMILGMIPVSLMTVFAATTNHPDAVTITVVDDVTGEPIEGAKVTYVIYDNSLGEDEMGNNDVPTDTNGEIVVFEGSEPGDIKISSIIVTHDDYATYTNDAYDQAITSLQDNFTIEMTCTKIKDVTVTPNDLTYNGEAQTSVTVEGLQQNDVVTYTIDGEPSADGKVTDAKTYAVVVKVERENFNALEIPVEVTVKPDTLDFDIAPISGLKYNEQEQTLVTLTGSFSEGDTVTWTVDGVDTGSRDIPKADAIGNYKVKLTVVRNANYNKFEKEVTVDIDTGVLNIDNLEVKANDRTYDSSTQDAVLVSNQGDYNIEYKLGEEGTWQTNIIPQITEAGTYKVYVRATKTGYHNAEYPTYPISVTIAQAKITGVTATGYSAKYDYQTSSPAVTKVSGTIEGDTVTYSDTENGEYTSTSKTVKKVKDSGTYYVKVFRNDNYETLIIPVTVSITKNDQQELSFGETPDRIYNEANTFKYAATTNAPDADGDIDYEKVGGTANFTVAEDGTVTYTSVGTIKVKATISSCDNYESASKTYEITVSYLPTPVWTITDETTTIGNCNWYNGDVVIKADGYEIIKDSNVLGQTAWTQEITETVEKDYPDYKVAFKNAAGDITDLVDVSYFAIDKTAPTEKNAISVEFKDKNANTLSKVINFLTFGLFCNEEVEVTVTCDDEALTADSPNSGIASIQLFKYDINGNPTEVALDAGKTNVFTLPVGFEGTVKVKATDKVGNTLGEQLITKDNSNMENVNGYVMIEETAPVLSELKDEALEGVRKEENTHNYSGDVKVTFEAQDIGSGLYSVTVKLNGENYPVTPTTFSAQNREKHSYELSTVGKTPDENGKFKFDVTVVDNAGNVITDTLTVEKDLTSPVITGFDFAVAAGDVDVQDVVSIEDYGYYFKEEVTVTVSAKDAKFNSQDHELVSGVEKITVVLVDKDGKYYTVNDQKVVTEITDITNAYAHVVTNDAFEFKITEDFKGQIYAFATDSVGNIPTNSTFDFGTANDNIVDDGALKGYKHPAGSVLESQDKHDHADYDHITFDKVATTLKTNDEKDNELYAGNVDVKLTVTDNYSGIAKIEWSVVAPYDVANNQEGTVTINNNENVAVNDVIGESGWKVLTKDHNLVTKVEQIITVKNDSNNIAVWVKLTDRAGNITEDTIKFNIDKQAPIMTVVMNDNDDDTYAGFFKEDRIYKVTILERNFINKNVEFVVTAIDDNGKESKVDVAHDFKLVMDGDAPKVTVNNGIEYYTYEWDSKFATDGDYKFSVSAIDLAENKTEDTAVSYVNNSEEPVDIRAISNAFTVDKTDPIISVSYDNNTATNEKYFAKARTATVVIKEHNFDVDRVDFTALTASLNKNTIDKPEIKWVSEGNVHTATIAFTADGDYTFDVKMTDKANRESKATDYGTSVAAKDFVVDQTIVKPTIGGIKDGGAYKEDVVPTISFNDVNYESYEIKLVRTRKDEKNVDVTDKFIKGINEDVQDISGSFDTFEKIVENDGIYTLTLKVKDKAGNEESEEYTFTVNRFGSVYVYNDKLSELIAEGGQYVQSIKDDIIITEYNADKLLEGSLIILITRDGETIDVDFTSNPEVNNTVTIGESGWYQYVYTIKASNFAKDGVYKISLASEYGADDSAKNESTSVPDNSTMEDGNAVEDNMTFTVDSVAPEIRNIVNLESAVADRENIVDNQLNVKYTIVDVGGLKTIEIIVDGEVIQTISGEEIAANAYNFTGNFNLKERTSAYTVQIKVTDLAGNVTDTNSEEFLEAHSKDNKESTYVFSNVVTVSRNFFVRWYAQPGLFWGSIAGVIVLVGAIWFLIAAKKKKKEENQ